MINESNSDPVHNILRVCPIWLTCTGVTATLVKCDSQRCLGNRLSFAALQDCLFLCVFLYVCELVHPCARACVLCGTNFGKSHITVNDSIWRRGAVWVMRPQRLQGGRRWYHQWHTTRVRVCLCLCVFVCMWERVRNISYKHGSAEGGVFSVIVWVFRASDLFSHTSVFIFSSDIRKQHKSCLTNQCLSACVACVWAAKRQDMIRTYLSSHSWHSLFSLQDKRQFLLELLVIIPVFSAGGLLVWLYFSNHPQHV